MAAWVNILSILVVTACWVPHLETTKGYRGEEKQEIGTLAGDVQNWAMLIENYILQVSGRVRLNLVSNPYSQNGKVYFLSKEMHEILIY